MKELTQLQYFRVVARLENVSRAAEELHVSQPNLSRAIKRLEEYIGLPLFDHTPGKVRLNEYGNVYLKYVDKAFDTLQSGERNVREMALESLEDKVSVACPMQMYMEEMIAAFVRDNPDSVLSIQHKQCDISEVDRGLWEGFFDFALTSKTDFSPGVEWNPVLSCAVSVLVSKSSKLAKKDEITLHDLRKEKFICNNAGISHSLTEEYCHAAGFHPNIVFESNDSVFVGTWLESERGVSLISAYDLFGLTESLFSQKPIKAIRIVDPEPIVVLGIAKPSDAEFSCNVNSFYKYAGTYFENIGVEISKKWPSFWSDSGKGV